MPSLLRHCCGRDMLFLFSLMAKIHFLTVIKTISMTLLCHANTQKACVPWTLTARLTNFLRVVNSDCWNFHVGFYSSNIYYSWCKGHWSILLWKTALPRRAASNPWNFQREISYLPATDYSSMLQEKANIRITGYFKRYSNTAKTFATFSSVNQTH